MQGLDFDVNFTNFLFKKLKRYIRKRDVKLFLRCKSLSQDDLDFIEQMSLIHLKNIQLDSKINQNLYGVLDNFIFNTLFSRHFFNSIDMFKILIYRLKVPKKLILFDVKYHLKGFLAYNLKQIKIDKKTQNAVYFLAPMPNTTLHIQSFLTQAKEILTLNKIQSIIINPLNLLLNPQLINKKTFIENFTQNLNILLNNANTKMIVLDNGYEFFSEILQSIEQCVSNLAYHISVAISIPSYHLDSKKMLESAIITSKKLVESKKARLIIRIKDVDIDYEKECFISNNNHKPNNTFTTQNAVLANLLSLVDKCRENTEYVEYLISSQNLFILSLLKDSNIKFEIPKTLNYPIFTLAKKQNIELINLHFFTNNFTQTLPLYLKSSLFNLNNNIFSLINMQLNIKEWDKNITSFENILFSLDSKNNKLDSNTLSDSLDINTFHYETFNYELQKGIKNYFIESKDSKSFLSDIQEMKFSALNKNKLEDVLYLNAEDLHRLSLQGLNNMPAKFSLHAQKEKEKLERAYKMQDDILANRMNIIASITNNLRKNIESIYDTLCEIYPQTPAYMIEEQCYMLIDTFKYYAFEYKKLLNETDSVLIMNIGKIFVDTNHLYIYEIAAILAADIMVGNITILSDSKLSRVLYYIFKDIIESCPFMTIGENRNANKIIVSKQDSISYQNNNLLVWDKGKSIVFISSFYNFSEAYLQISQMKYFGNQDITIYTDEYIYNMAKETFIPLLVVNMSLGDLINSIPENVSNISIFTYNKAEMNYALNNTKISLRINAGYRYRLISGSTRAFLPGYLPPFGSNILLTKLLLTSPNSVIKNNSLYGDIIGCFSGILSMDEVEFLYNLNHNYAQFLNNIQRKARLNNIFELKKPYNMYIRVYKKDDFFHICVIMLIAFLLDIKTKVSFEPTYFTLESNEDSKKYNYKEDLLEVLESNLKEKYIELFNIVIESEDEFLNTISPFILIRIMQDESDFSSSETYKVFRQKGIIAEYSLPILNKNLELEKYLATQYIQIEPNFLLQTSVEG